MAANSSGFTIAAGMGMMVLLMGYTLLNAAGLVGFASESQTELTEAAVGGCGVVYPTEAASTAMPMLSSEEAILYATGDALFKGNCAQCHALQDKVVGPALAGVHQRRPVAWLKSWVKNSSKMVAAGDEYGVKIFNEYGKQQMPRFSLSDQEIEAILKYVKVEESRSPLVAVN